MHASAAAQARAPPGAPPVLSESQDVTLESLSRQAGWEDENFVEASRQRSEGQVSLRLQRHEEALQFETLKRLAAADGLGVVSLDACQHSTVQSGY